MTFGEKLQKLRKEAGMSQEELAARLDVSRQAVSKWERDSGYPETEKIVRMGKLFHVTMDYLLNEDTPDSPGTAPAGPAQAAGTPVPEVPACRYCAGERRYRARNAVLNCPVPRYPTAAATADTLRRVDASSSAACTMRCSSRY